VHCVSQCKEVNGTAAQWRLPCEGWLQPESQGKWRKGVAPLLQLRLQI